MAPSGMTISRLAITSGQCPAAMPLPMTPFRNLIIASPSPVLDNRSSWTHRHLPREITIVRALSISNPRRAARIISPTAPLRLLVAHRAQIRTLPINRVPTNKAQPLHRRHLPPLLLFPTRTTNNLPRQTTNSNLGLPLISSKREATRSLLAQLPTTTSNSRELLQPIPSNSRDHHRLNNNRDRPLTTSQDLHRQLPSSSPVQTNSNREQHPITNRPQAVTLTISNNREPHLQTPNNKRDRLPPLSNSQRPINKVVRPQREQLLLPQDRITCASEKVSWPMSTIARSSIAV